MSWKRNEKQKKKENEGRKNNENVFLWDGKCGKEFSEEDVDVGEVEGRKLLG